MWTPPMPFNYILWPSNKEKYSLYILLADEWQDICGH